MAKKLNLVERDKTIWLQISSGRCPAECQWVVARLSQYIINFCAKTKINSELLETIAGDENGTFKSALIRLTGNNLQSCIDKFCGTILWHGQSPFRPRHKRKNWYVGVESLSFNLNSDSDSHFEKEIKIETFKASGKGGQNVNKRDTAVRITHLPTKIAVVGREERTQLMNKKLALARLKAKLCSIKDEQINSNEKERWKQHDNLERGNPVIRFEGNTFKPY